MDPEICNWNFGNWISEDALSNEPRVGYLFSSHNFWFTHKSNLFPK